jgi:two-component system, NarL family, invasion response regulator UvrY
MITNLMYFHPSIASSIKTCNMEPIKQVKLTTVAMADDHNMLRNALAQMIEGFGNYKVVVQASNGKDLLEKLSRMEIPDLLLLDISMPEMNGIETAKQISRYYPEIKIIALSMMDNETSVVSMVKNGARGYILKDAEPAQLKEALHNVLKHGYHFSEKVTGRMVHSLQQENGNAEENTTGLSEREKQFCILACTELTYKEIANKMGVSPRTVDGYRDVLFEKLGLKTRVGLAMYAVKMGMVNHS